MDNAIPAYDWLAEALAEHRAIMLARADRIVKNRADAEDVVQEALERAWRSRRRFMAEAKVVPWLLTITRNVALNLLSRRGRADLLAGDEAFPATAPVDSEVAQREGARSIALAICRLAPAHRTAFVLHVQGYSTHDISLTVHVPYQTVRTHLFRARVQLRAALAGVES